MDQLNLSPMQQHEFTMRQMVEQFTLVGLTWTKPLSSSRSIARLELLPFTGQKDKKRLS